MEKREQINNKLMPRVHAESVELHLWVKLLQRFSRAHEAVAKAIEEAINETN